MRKFKSAFEIESYQLLKADRFDEAIAWIRQQKAMTRPRLRRTSNEKWRQEHYGIIWGAMRTLGLKKQEVYDFALEHEIVKKSITSLTELRERELEALSEAFGKLAKKIRRKPESN